MKDYMNAEQRLKAILQSDLTFIIKQKLLKLYARKAVWALKLI
jgi:cell fate (sporulation/competence/biofilm development) regulator YlbF (YheA/YmcA/DUF963 family)